MKDILIESQVVRCSHFNPSSRWCFILKHWHTRICPLPNVLSKPSYIKSDFGHVCLMELLDVILIIIAFGNNKLILNNYTCMKQVLATE